MSNHAGGADRGEKSRKTTGDELWDHRWGYRDTDFRVEHDGSVVVTGSRYLISGTPMDGLLPFVREALDVELDTADTFDEKEIKSVPPPRRDRRFLKIISEALNPDSVSDNDRERLIHSHGQTLSEDLYPVLYGEMKRVVDLVVWPETEQQVAAVVEAASKAGVCLVPYGGGTNVSGALVIPEGERRMVVSVDMRRMNRLIELDEQNRRATFEAGITGSELERVLSERGFTCGHEPDSIELSTLGGWIATYASGMKKNKYGNIEDMVERVTLITPAGPVTSTSSFPRSSIGIQPLSLVMGNEGNFGIITSAVIHIHPAPEVLKYGSFLFHNENDGIEFLRDVARETPAPASVRLVDNTQFRFGQSLKGRHHGVHKAVSKLQKFLITRILRFHPYRMVVATVVMEGKRKEVALQNRRMRRIAKTNNGFAAGGSNGRQGYLLTFAIAYIRDFMVGFHIFGETFETTVPWDKIEPLTRAVAERLDVLCDDHGIPGKPFLSYRITQIYHTGVCIYYTLGLYMKGVHEPARVLSEIEHDLRRCILDEGGSLSHHHGVGKIRAEFLPGEITDAARDAITGIKKACDPDNVFGIGNNLFAPDRR